MHMSLIVKVVTSYGLDDRNSIPGRGIEGDLFFTTASRQNQGPT
jgi:hypothetical protein